MSLESCPEMVDCRVVVYVNFPFMTIFGRTTEHPKIRYYGGYCCRETVNSDLESTHGELRALNIVPLDSSTLLHAAVAANVKMSRRFFSSMAELFFAEVI